MPSGPQNPATGSTSGQITTVSDEEIKSTCLQSMTGKIRQKPELLKESTGTEACCVYRVPKSLVDINEKAYLPLIVSIGPYHSENDQFKTIQEQKWRYLGILLSRAAPHVGLGNLFDAISPLEEEIRNSYSEVIKLEKSQLVEMMLLDGCFLIELFCRSTKLVAPEANDPIFKIPWVLPYVLRDLLRLENQIPFPVLKELYELVKSGLGSGRTALPSLTELALKFFNRALGRDDRVIKKYYGLKGRHLLDLFCLSFIPSPPSTRSLNHQLGCNYIGHLCLRIGNKESSKSKLGGRGFYSALKLHQAGIKFEIRETDSFLDVKFDNGVLKIPRFTIDDFTASVFLNAIAFEQSYIHRQDYFTTYANFMGRLVNTPEDVGFLCDSRIVENHMGNDAKIVQFFNTVLKDVVIDLGNGYLKEVFEGIENYRRTKRAKVHASWAELWGKYFGSPWALASVLGALAGLVLTAIQAYYAIHPKK